MIIPGPTVLRHDQIGERIIVDAIIEKEAMQQIEDDPAPAETANFAVEEVLRDDPNGELRYLNLLPGIPLKITVELGSARKRTGDVLKMEQGAGFELLQLDGKAVNLLVNDTLVAKGDLLVEKEKYGIRMVEIVSRRAQFRSSR